MPDVRRMLRWFDRQTDELAGQEALRGARVEELSRIFNRPADDPMYASYEVLDAQRKAIQPLVTHEIQLDQYAYFVEAVPVAQPARR